MPSKCSYINNLLKKIDLFPCNSLLRYNGQSQYSTATGGVISVIIIVLFTALFSSMGLKTINKQIITSSVTTTYEQSPSSLTFNANPEGGFMFALLPWGFTLNASANERLFDVRVLHQYYHPIFRSVNQTQIPLEPCTEQHFNFSEEVLRSYNLFNLKTGLCPPMNYKFNLVGKYTSQLYSQLVIQIMRCNSTIDPSCLNDSSFATMEPTLRRFVLSVPLVSSFINANQENYKDYYYNNQNTFTFTSQLGISSRIDINEDIIETDVSILPFQQIQTQKVIRVLDKFDTTYYVPSGAQGFCSLTFTKSSEVNTYHRSFNKVDNYLSYVGGIIGIIISLIFILGKYNEKAYQISIAHKIMKSSDGQQVRSRSFNFFYFMLMPVKSIFDCCCNLNWDTTQKYIDASEEVTMQLDVAYILKKLQFMDSAIDILLKKSQLDILYLKEKPSLDGLKKKRKRYFYSEFVKHKMNQVEERKTEQLTSGKKGNIESSISKQHLFDSLDFEGKKQEIKQSQFEDLSALQLSIRGSQMNQIKRGLSQMYRQDPKAKQKSKHLTKDVSPDFIENMTSKKVDDQKDGLSSNVMQILPSRIKREDFIDSHQNQKRGFDFPFEKVE